MKKALLTITAVLLLLCIGCGLIWQQMRDYTRIVSANWDITIPRQAGCSEVYRADSGDSFQGDGLRYHVFACKTTVPLDTLVAWTATDYRPLAEGWLDELAVPADERPDYASCLSYRQTQADGSSLLLFLDCTAGRLYILESFL